MSSNQKLILDTLLQQRKDELDPSMSSDDYFELFVSEQILKDNELSFEEIEEGVVGSGNDGGIDSVYVFGNSDLLRLDSDLLPQKRDSRIQVVMIQAKNQSGFPESAIQKFIQSTRDLYDLNKGVQDLKSVYNAELLDIRENFKRQYLNLASKFPKLTFKYFLATKGSEVHPNVSRQVENLEQTIKGHFDDCEFSFEFISAENLVNLTRKEQIRSKDIVLTESPISTDDGGYIAIAPIKNYFNFLIDENGKLIKYFFDANIRDYQGTVEVNRAINETLVSSSENEDFWWLNNGITITASKATIASKRLLIDDPQIVNGLQTSYEIFKYFNANSNIADKRNVLLRIVTPETESSRLKIIKATNSQTNIPPASLRATDPIHRNIEDYLYSHGYYYDRRKNYHKNQGKPTSKIISISYMAQIVMSILLSKPDYARARPSTLIKNDQDYERIFSDQMPLDVYLKCAQLQDLVKSELKFFEPKLTRAQINDIRFYLMIAFVGIKSRTATIKRNNVVNLSIDSPHHEHFFVQRLIGDVYSIYNGLGGDDNVAKGSDFVKSILEYINSSISEEE